MKYSVLNTFFSSAFVCVRLVYCYYVPLAIMICDLNKGPVTTELLS